MENDLMEQMEQALKRRRESEAEVRRIAKQIAGQETATSTPAKAVLTTMPSVAAPVHLAEPPEGSDGMPSKIISFVQSRGGSGVHVSEIIHAFAAVGSGSIRSALVRASKPNRRGDRLEKVKNTRGKYRYVPGGVP